MKATRLVDLGDRHSIPHVTIDGPVFLRRGSRTSPKMGVLRLPNALVERIEDRVLEVYLKAQCIWGRSFELPIIWYDVEGTCAGTANRLENRIRFNPVLANENQDDFVKQTIPHEVAHLLTHELHKNVPRIKPHGREWKAVMLALGLEPKTCHRYDVPNARIRRRQQ